MLNATNSNFPIPISLQPDGVAIDDMTEFIV